MIGTTIATFGRLDILVNNAGIQHVSPIERFPTEKWDAVIAIDLSSAFHDPARATAMRQGGGRIINVASAHALVGSPFKAAYVAAKHGLLGLTKVVALETAEDNITATPSARAMSGHPWSKPKSRGRPSRTEFRASRSSVMCSWRSSPRNASPRSTRSEPSRPSWRAMPRFDHWDGAAGRRWLDRSLSGSPGPIQGRTFMTKHVKSDAWKSSDRSDKSLRSELERTGTPPTAVTERPVARRPRARPRPIRRSLARSFSSCRAAALSGPIRSAPTRLCTKPASSRMGDRHLDRRDQCRPDRRQRSSGPDVAAAGILGSDAAQPLDGNVGGLADAGAAGLQADDGRPRHRPSSRPNGPAFLGPHVPLGPDAAAYYDTSPLARTLAELVDVDRINRGETRLTVGAANVRTSEMRYFDSRDMDIDLRHVMASGALPAFPAIRIDEDLYWDGGILSNTPVEAVFDDNPRRNSVVFAVHIWNPEERNRTRSGRSCIARRTFNTRAAPQAISPGRSRSIGFGVISELVRRLPEEERNSSEVKEARGVWMPHPHARHSVARLSTGGPHQGHRFQPKGNPPALGERLHRHASRDGALVRQVRPHRRLHPA